MMKKKSTPTPGRPKFPEGTTRNKQLTVWVTPAEHAALVAMADADSRPLGDYLVLGRLSKRFP